MQGFLRKPVVVERSETVDSRSEWDWSSILARLTQH